MSTHYTSPGRIHFAGVPTILMMSIVVFSSFTGLPTSRAEDGPTTTPARAKAITTYDRAIELLASGDQAAAEELLGNSLKSATEAKRKFDPSEVFLVAVLIRSRFEIDQSTPIFKAINQTFPNTLRGKAAGYIVQLDSGSANVDENFKGLQELADKNPSDPLTIWMVGVQCRSLHRNEIGVDAYAKLCKLWKPGPVLVHQTYANLLHELGRYDDALVERNLAVKLEPAPWSYDGLANTLTCLKRWKEADEAYAKAIDMAPNRYDYYDHLALSKSLRGDTESAAKLTAKARELEKAYPMR